MNLRDLPDMSAAYKQVQEKNDGNLANNAPPYDKVTRRDVITGRLGKDEMGGKRKQHDCAKKVNYKAEEFDVIPEMHTMLEDGTVTHYDITNGEYIYENVPVEELEILISEKHEHFTNYDKNAEVLGEEVEGYIDFLIDEGYDCSDLTWEEIVEEYESLDEGLRSAVKKLLGKKDKPAEKKPESRGEQLRKKYNVGPEKSDTSAKRQILDRTRARKERDEKEYGGSHYSKSVAKKSADAHDRYLRAGYSKYGADRKTGSGNKARKRAAALKKEAFAFSDVEWEELAMLGEEIDTMTDEQLIDFMEEIILEVAEDDQDLLEICEALEEVELISERVDPKETQRRRDQAKDRLATGAAMKKAAEKSSGPSRLERMKTAAKGAAKKVGSAVKAGAKMAGKAANKAGKAAVTAAGKAAGTYQGEKEAARIKAKRASMQNTPAKKKDDDDDGTDGKLDKLLADTRGKSSSSTSSSGGGGARSSSSSASSSSGSTRKAAGGALRSVGRLVKKGLKKAVGKTARVVSRGSDALAKRLGEDYEMIAHLYESGMFEIHEIENIVEADLAGKARKKAVEMGRQRRSTKEYKQGGARGTGRNERAAYNIANAQSSSAADLGKQKAVDKSSGIQGHMKKALANKKTFNYADVLAKRDPKKNPKHTENK